MCVSTECNWVPCFVSDEIKRQRLQQLMQSPGQQNWAPVVVQSVFSPSVITGCSASLAPTHPHQPPCNWEDLKGSPQRDTAFPRAFVLHRSRACSHKLSTQGGPIIAATALHVDSTLQFTRLFYPCHSGYPFPYAHDGLRVVYIPGYTWWN